MGVAALGSRVEHGPVLSGALCLPLGHEVFEGVAHHGAGDAAAGVRVGETRRDLGRGARLTALREVRRDELPQGGSTPGRLGLGGGLRLLLGGATCGLGSRTRLGDARDRSPGGLLGRLARCGHGRGADRLLHGGKQGVVVLQDAQLLLERTDLAGDVFAFGDVAVEIALDLGSVLGLERGAVRHESFLRGRVRT